MRKSFFESLTKSAKQDESLILLTADLGFGFIEDFMKNCPNQFINVGVSEQAMLGLANGLATTAESDVLGAWRGRSASSVPSSSQDSALRLSSRSITRLNIVFG